MEIILRLRLPRPQFIAQPAITRLVYLQRSVNLAAWVWFLTNGPVPAIQDLLDLSQPVIEGLEASSQQELCFSGWILFRFWLHGNLVGDRSAFLFLAFPAERGATVKHDCKFVFGDGEDQECLLMKSLLISFL